MSNFAADLLISTTDDAIVARATARAESAEFDQTVAELAAVEIRKLFAAGLVSGDVVDRAHQNARSVRYTAEIARMAVGDAARRLAAPVTEYRGEQPDAR